jgi:hypothetical protein
LPASHISKATNSLDLRREVRNMKRFLLIAFTFLPAFSIFSFAQNLTGIWRGYFITENYEQYKFEVQIDHKTNTLSGVTYSYLDKRFYGKSSMTGNFTEASNNALIQEIKTLEVKMAPISHTCIQKFQLSYVKSGKEEFLEGTFSSIIEKTDSISGYFRGDDCGGGTMYLRKVTTSDFYIEPFLRKKSGPATTTPPLVKNTTPNTKPATTPPPSTKTSTQKNTTTGNQNKNAVAVKPKIDSVKKADVTAAITEPQKNIITRPGSKVPEILKTRENNLVQTLLITDENVVVRIYDNGEIDDDTISVYLDNQLILSKKRLTTAALTVNLKMDESNPNHELVMVANNLGSIPPNTSLMYVTTGSKRYEVFISSNEKSNAKVVFDLKE